MQQIEQHCPHCNHVNHAQQGELRRCDECEKPYEHGEKTLTAPPIAPPPPPPLEKNCPFCAEKIKSEAVKCKHCGEMLNQESDVETSSQTQEQKVSIVGIVVLVLFLLWGLGKCTGGNTQTKPVDKVAALFSGWDGSNREMVRATEARMKDPDSFEHVETRYSKRGDKVFIKMTFRGKNAFNATVTNTATGFVNPDTRALSHFAIQK